MSQTVGLAMIVRDEAEDIEACLTAALPFIDSWCIVDTGSKDQTPRLVKQTLKGKPGKLHRSKWRNFGHNRTELMRLAKGTADYLLILDADLIVEHDGPLPALKWDMYYATVEGSLDYKLPLLIKGDKDWEYRGAAHCYMHSPGGYTDAILPGLTVLDRGHPSPGKFERDLEALSAEYAVNPLDARNLFYLAQTYETLERWDEAIDRYRERTALKGFVEEDYIAKLRLGKLLCEHRNAHEGLPILCEAWAMRPHRAEALKAMEHVARNVAAKIPYPKDELLFVEPAAYTQEPAAPKLLYPWNEWREKYDSMTFEDHRAWYDRVAQSGESQARYDVDALKPLLRYAMTNTGYPVNVTELGGWDGALAAEVLAKRGAPVGTWTNYEISAEAASAGTCTDTRYDAVALTDWYWRNEHRADVFVASHVIEHLTLADLRKTLDATDCRYVYLQAPLNDEPTDWHGYDGGHILEVGWLGVDAELAARNFVPIPHLCKPTVRCYERRALMEAAA